LRSCHICFCAKPGTLATINRMKNPNKQRREKNIIISLFCRVSYMPPE
jgi:hypothetical protein